MLVMQVSWKIGVAGDCWGETCGAYWDTGEPLTYLRLLHESIGISIQIERLRRSNGKHKRVTVEPTCSNVKHFDVILESFEYLGSEYQTHVFVRVSNTKMFMTHGVKDLCCCHCAAKSVEQTVLDLLPGS